MSGVEVRPARSPEERSAAWKIRAAVFIGEQGIAEDIERDGLDDLAEHFVAWENGRAVGTARLLHLDGTGRVIPCDAGVAAAKIGRMAVLPEQRGTGIGRQLLGACLDAARAAGSRRAELSAQAPVVSFYEKAGFRSEGEPYLEAGIPHRRMTLDLGRLTIEEAVGLFESRRDAWLRGDLDAYLALWCEDMTFQSPVHAEPLRGREAFAELVRHSFAFSRPLRFEFEHLAVQGSWVLAEWTIAIERREDGRRLEWRGMSVAELRGGRIAVWREYWNPLALT